MTSPITTRELDGVTLFFSASVPSGRERAPTAERGQELIVQLLGGVLLAGGRVVFGGHPTITPLVHHLVQAWRLPPGSVQLHQLRCFSLKPGDSPWQTADRSVFSDLVEHGAATPWREKSPATQAAELAEMRDAMCDAATAAFLVGGQLPAHSLGAKPGLRDEFERFRARHPNAPVFLSSLLDGYTATTLIPEARAGELQTHTPLSPAEQRVLEESESVEVVAGLTLAGLRRPARPGA